MSLITPTREGQIAHLSRLADTLILNYAKAIKHLKIRPQAPNVLVLNGDIAKDGKPEEFAIFEEHFLTKLIEELHPENIVVVPGNHDVQRPDSKRDADSDESKVVGTTPVLNDSGFRTTTPKDGSLEAFWNFVRRIVNRFPNQKWCYPPESDDEEVAPCTCGSTFPVHIYPFNSSEFSGKAERTIVSLIEELSRYKKNIADEVYDAAIIKSFEPYRKALEKYPRPAFRVAVVHHNSLPFRYEGRRLKQYGFINAGQFNTWLLEHSFNLLLSGHQHEGGFFRVSDLQQRRKTSIFQDLIVSGAPAFGAASPVETGFTVSVLDEVDPVSVSVHVCKIIPDPASSDYSLYPPQVTDSVHYVTIAEAAEKNDLCRELTKMVAHDVQTDDLREIVDRWQAGPQAERFFRELHLTRQTRQDIRAMYSLSVFPPKLWTEKRLAEFFLPEANRNIAHAVSWAKSIEARLAGRNDHFKARLIGGKPSLHFRFSRPLCSAIQFANRSAYNAAIGGDIAEAFKLKVFPKNSQGDREKAFLQRCGCHLSAGGYSQSLSVWGNAAKLEDFDLDTQELETISTEVENGLYDLHQKRLTIDNLPLSFSELKYRPRANISDIDQQIIKNQLFEFPRILLWEPEMFLRPDAIQCIEFHEYCGFPLFWIDPARLGTRYHEGHYNLFARALDEPRYCYYAARNNEVGLINPPRDDSEFDPNSTDPLWSMWRGSLPNGLSRTSSFVAEFAWFLERPDICFAVDAWAARRFLQEDGWSNFVSSLGANLHNS